MASTYWSHRRLYSWSKSKLVRILLRCSKIILHLLPTRVWIESVSSLKGQPPKETCSPFSCFCLCSTIASLGLVFFFCLKLNKFFRSIISSVELILSTDLGLCLISSCPSRALVRSTYTGFWTENLRFRFESSYLFLYHLVLKISVSVSLAWFDFLKPGYPSKRVLHKDYTKFSFVLSSLFLVLIWKWTSVRKFWKFVAV